MPPWVHRALPYHLTGPGEQRVQQCAAALAGAQGGPGPAGGGSRGGDGDADAAAMTAADSMSVAITACDIPHAIG